MAFHGRTVLSRVLCAAGLLVLTASLALAGEPGGRITSPSGGAVHALVAGIDGYKYVRQLHGAVNDANDIYAAAKNGGVEDATLLLDEKATRANFLRALEAIHARAIKGDLVILTFAGHGMKMPERIPNSKEDHQDEAVLFADFNPESTGTQDRVFGYEIFDHLKQFHEAGVRVLYLADSCFGGGMTKGTDARATSLSIRGFQAVYDPALAVEGKMYVKEEGGRSPARNPADNKKTAVEELPSLTFVAAVSSAVEAPEIDLGPDYGGVRGLASYALARALEGAASSEGIARGVTTRGSLAHFVRTTVDANSGGRQMPVVEPDRAGALEEVVFRIASQHSAPAKYASNQPPSDVCVAARTTRGVELLESSGAGPQARHCQQAGALGAKLTWDVQTGDVIDDEGVLVASHVDESGMPAIKLRSEVLRDAVRVTTGRQVRSWLAPKQTRFVQDERFEAHFSGLSGYWLTIVNVTGKGTVQYLFPSPGEDNYNTDSEKTLHLRAKPPFGTDTLIVFATKDSAPVLTETLNPAGGSPNLERLRNALRLLGEDDKVGFAFFLTLPPQSQ